MGTSRSHENHRLISFVVLAFGIGAATGAGLIWITNKSLLAKAGTDETPPAATGSGDRMLQLLADNKSLREENEELKRQTIKIEMRPPTTIAKKEHDTENLAARNKRLQAAQEDIEKRFSKAEVRKVALDAWKKADSMREEYIIKENIADDLAAAIYDDTPKIGMKESALELMVNAINVASMPTNDMNIPSASIFTTYESAHTKTIKLDYGGAYFNVSLTDGVVTAISTHSRM